MIIRPPTPIDSLVRTIQQLVDTSVRQSDVRLLIKTCLDGIAGATQELWHHPAMEQADQRRLMREALEFYADGGADKGKRARAVFAILEADRAEYWRPLPTVRPYTERPGGGA